MGAGVGGADESIYDLQELPGGDLLAIGIFSSMGGVPTRGIARWNGSSWQAVDGGINGFLSAIALRPDGEIVVGGAFDTAGTQQSAYFARLLTNRPALAVPYGAGCSGTAGPVGLTATALPWLGSTYRAASSTLSPAAIALDVYGLSAAQTPLSALLSVAAAGCQLLVAPEIWTVLVPQNGIAVGQLALPNTPALLAAQIRHQMLVGELGAGAQLLQAASSNGLLLTLGGF